MSEMGQKLTCGSKRRLTLYPRNQTSSASVGMSEKCQRRKFIGIGGCDLLQLAKSLQAGFSKCVFFGPL